MDICSPLDCLSEVLDDVPDLAFAFNNEGRYLYVNQAGARFLRFEAAELIGQHWSDLGLPADAMEPLESQVQMVVQSCQSTMFVLHGAATYGSRVWDVSLTPMMCDRDEVVAVLAIAHDITKYVEASR